MNFYNISNIQSSLFLCPGKHFRYAATIEPSDLTSRVSSKPWKRNNLLYVQWSSKSLVQMLTFSFWQIFQILSCLSSTCDEKLLVGGGSGAAQRLREADEVRPVRHLLHRQGAGHHRPALLLRRGLHPSPSRTGSRISRSRLWPRLSLSARRILHSPLHRPLQVRQWAVWPCSQVRFFIILV